jgi:hypothetical protein
VTEPSLPDKVVALHETLERAGIPHAFGGALALAYYAEPRTTVDIDLNVFVGLDRAGDVARALRPLGVDALPLEGDAPTRDGQVRCRWGRTPIDLFFAYDALHDAMRARASSVPFGADAIPILAAEHLVVCKAVFNRPKDWLDIEQVLATTDGFDTGEVLAELERLLGRDDPRATRLRAAVHELTD